MSSTDDSIPGTEPFRGPEGTRPHIDFAQSPPVSIPGAGVAADLEPGKLIAERYRIEQRIKERGGQSQLYLCSDAHLPEGGAESGVVVKLYLQGQGPKQEILDLIRGINHPDLVHILDIGTWEGCFFEVMEYCRGGSLADGMPYTTGQLRALLPQIVSGLDHCHTLNITHRDIKPWNLLFRDPERHDLVLTDFGISSYLRRWEDRRSDPQISVSVGSYTVDYVGPEFLSGAVVDHPLDYYALGITLLHLYKGESPFRGLFADAIRSAHTQNRIPIEGVPADLRQLVLGLTQFDPGNRWNGNQIRQWLAGTTVTTDDGRPWAHRPAAIGSKPFRGVPSVRTPVELSRAIVSGAMPHADAVKHLASSYIWFWVGDLDERLGQGIETLKLVDMVTKDPAGALKELAWLLDPQLPLETSA